MPSQPPLIMVDNVCDRINLYTLGTIVSRTTPLVGREQNFLADYRRERTYYQTLVGAVTPGIQVDSGAGVAVAVDSVWIDRGHNLWGRTVNCEGGTDGATWFNPTLFSYVVPAFGTVGGDPTTGWCVTEEGALYTLPTNAVARQWWRLYDPGTTQWLLTGVIMGRRVQLSSPAGYSSVLDEDAGERTERSEGSLVPGYEGADRTYAARKVELRLAYIGATEYDAAIRGLRRTLYEVGQPAVVCMNYGTKPERAWLYKYRGKDWSSPTKGATRSVNITLFECGPLIR